MSVATFWQTKCRPTRLLIGGCNDNPFRRAARASAGPKRFRRLRRSARPGRAHANGNAACWLARRVHPSLPWDIGRQDHNYRRRGDLFRAACDLPGLAGLISLYGLVADSGTIAQHLDSLAGILPEGGLLIIRDELQQLTSQPPQKLGFATAGSLAVSLWSANGGIKAMFEGLNAVYHENEKRSFIRLNALSLAFTMGVLGFVIAALLTITIVPQFLSSFLGLPGIGEVVNIARWPVLFIVTCFMIAVVYRFGPSRKRPQWRWISPGSFFAALVWIAASLLFSWYTSHFGNYNKTYGSLGAAVGFMTWMWISTIVILVGAKINAELEHQTGVDTTEGPAALRGERGAQMADTIGKRP